MGRRSALHLRSGKPQMCNVPFCICGVAQEVGGIGVLGMARDGAREARRKHPGKANRGSARSHCEKMQSPAHVDVCRDAARAALRVSAHRTAGRADVHGGVRRTTRGELHPVLQERGGAPCEASPKQEAAHAVAGLRRATGRVI